MAAWASTVSAGTGERESTARTAARSTAVADLMSPTRRTTPGERQAALGRQLVGGLELSDHALAQEHGRAHHGAGSTA